MDDVLAFDDIESLKNVSGIASEVRKHLLHVYAALLATSLSASLGVVFFKLTFFPPFLSMLISIGMICYISFKPEVTDQKPDVDAVTRGLVLLGFGFFQGASLGGLILTVMMMDPNIVLTATVGTLLVFACLSGSALVAKRKTYLFLGGYLASAVVNLFFLVLVNMFLQLEFLDMFGLYAGLFVFCGYVLYDTQLIIEKANTGSRDYVKHSAELFTDLVAIFVRILIILSKSSRRNN